MNRLVVLSSLAVVASGLLVSSCNRRVFEKVENTCLKTVATDIPVPTEKAADILIVVDNSGSMAEEQQNLVENFLNQDAGECPLQDLANIPSEYKNPVRSLYTSGGVLSRCGFIQLLSAFENDFRVGVITTDVGICDNRIPDSQGGDAWGFRPQRGCLQPDSAPGGSGRKLISATDLTDADNGNDDFAQRFRSTLENIQTFGSPFERGLDAVDLFFNAAADTRAPGCEGDLGTFRRDDAALVVIFLTDEEDCSHGQGGMLEVFGNENDGEVCGEFPEHFLNVQPAKCYANPEELSPVDGYVDSLLAADANVKVAVIAGGVGDAGSITPSGCRVSGSGTPEGGDTNGDGVNDSCYESGGLSNFTGAGPNNPCGPDTAAARGDLPCCVADAGSRYYQLAQSIGNAATDSICNASFRASMLDIAAFIAAVDQVALAEPPANPSAVIVEITRAGSSDQEKVDALPSGADCATEDGYLLVDERFIQLCGSARPGPGDTISVRAAGQASEECLAAQ
ncbi:MAG: hypothetical protein A2138_12325 [Deltaproteobacteria bacterium RBG_16_71_12]|nr:MAG: hypothetical protein A2138_12325 [Deltaproteobacteria bacterium RBG_16_71_12]